MVYQWLDKGQLSASFVKRVGSRQKSCYMYGGILKEENHLQPGNHTFNFEFIIPKCCPSSFEHKYGNIRYEIKIIFDRASKGNKEKKIPMRVISPLDLNQDPYSKEPIAFSIDDTYSCCCISSGFSEVIVKLPLTGYCPEQIIPVELLCSNNSSVEIKQIKLAIIKVIGLSFYKGAYIRTARQRQKQPQPSPHRLEGLRHQVNLPYPAANPPYPITDSRYTNPNPGLEFRVQGIEQSGSLSPISVTSVIVAPSAPEPSTPDDDKKPGRALYSQENINTSNYNHPYNPEFMNHNNKNNEQQQYLPPSSKATSRLLEATSSREVIGSAFVCNLNTPDTLVGATLCMFLKMCLIGMKLA
ncbi:Arrestin domain-containing protein 1 [Eumeta japonica]|uniref:Arrestin domain-containing protein 1 n=1 Tax=Eumeta variegata TaxID=151549 RepID=A0A4C1UVJ1_EUMVA|nr:Arrestin domain-containing protein 1 [Eumeta japonica]